MAEQLDRDGQLEAAGGLAYLADLTENTPSAANAGSYAGIVRDHGARRRVMALANDVASYARQSKSELSGIHSLAARLVGEVEGIGEPEPRLPGETWEAKEPPPREWIIRDLLPAGRLAALYGSGASGKSMMALQWAAAIMHGGAPLRAAGAGAGGEDARRKLKADFAALQPLAESAHGRVLWLTWEDETAELIRRWRMAYHAKAIGEPFPDPDRLTLVNMRKLGGALWAPKAGGHVSTRATWTPAGERFLRSLEGHKLAVIDPLAAAFASSEIDRALVRAFTSAIDGEAESTRCAVLLIAHPSQSGAGKGGGGYSGSTDWQASVRAHLVLEASDNTAHTVGPKSDNKAPAYRPRNSHTRRTAGTCGLSGTGGAGISSILPSSHGSSRGPARRRRRSRRTRRGAPGARCRAASNRRSASPRAHPARRWTARINLVKLLEGSRSQRGGEGPRGGGPGSRGRCGEGERAAT